MYQVSALEVEREMLALPEISECAVVALPSEAWGQKVAAVVVLTEKGRSSGNGGKPFSALDLRRALKEKIVAYKMPQEMKVVEVIPRNAMGKSEFSRPGILFTTLPLFKTKDFVREFRLRTRSHMEVNCCAVC